MAFRSQYTSVAVAVQSAVDTLNKAVSSLSGIADRIPRRRSTRQSVAGKRTEDRAITD